MRSRAVSLPEACCFSMRSVPPPRSILARFWRRAPLWASIVIWAGFVASVAMLTLRHFAAQQALHRDDRCVCGDLHVITAVHVQFLASNVVAIGGQKGSCFGNFLGRRETAERNLRFDLSSNLLGNSIHHFRGRDPWRNGVSGDVKLREFQSQRLGERDDATFAGRVVGLPKSSHLAYYRADIDNPSEPLVHHRGHCCTGAVEVTV